MGGICGFNWSDAELVAAMADEMIHRGPDQHGEYCAEGISLGHRRLSVIDLSEHGRQPMANEDDSIRLVCDGEIYNSQELRDDLRAKGHQFVSRSDAEVIVHAYEEYGSGAVGKLRGMFAFALWDGRQNVLWLGRDRIGIKPLYYCFRAGKLVFASEIKAILKDPTVERRLNAQALYDYIGGEFVPAPETLLEGICKLPAGHTLRLQNGQIDVQPYWDLKFATHPWTGTYEEAVEQLRALLDQAIRSHLVGDVPLGVLLSGGLASSAIVAMMRRHITGPLRTFTIGHADKTCSELDYAQIVADRFETEHHVLMIDDFTPDRVEQALWHLDEPMTDFSAVPLYLVCRQARAYATVCLSGAGGNECCAGYDRFKASRINRRYCARIPGPLRRGLVGPLVAALPDRPGTPGALHRLKRFVEGALLPPAGAHLRWQTFRNATREQALFTPEFRGRVSLDPFRLIRETMARCDTLDEVNREIYLDMRYRLTDGVLLTVDKMSMANSVELRVPLSDHVFVEFMASLPGDWKLHGLQTKHIFRSALQGILPDRIVARGQQDYNLPVEHLLRGALQPYMTDLLNQSPVIRENLDVTRVNRLIREHLAMRHNHSHVLWALMNVAIWHNRFLP